MPDTRPDNVVLAQLKVLLLARRKELEDLRAVSAGSRAAVTLDQQSVGRVSRIDAMQGQAMAQAQERQRAAELVRIERSLSKIAEDEYGYCEECAEPIASKRLFADPTVRLCIRCATSAEAR
jgi:DnaK suppressor protein